MADPLKLSLIGPPGAGKGTQARTLSERYGIPAISTGAMLRAAQESGSEIGEEVGKYIDQGKLAPVDLVVDVVQERLSQEDAQKGFILDGSPRTMEEAKTLPELDAVFCLDLPAQVVTFRLSARHNCPDCGLTYQAPGTCTDCGTDLYRRKDDTPEGIRERLNEYHKKSAPIKDHYSDKGNLCWVDGTGKEEEVTARITKYLEDECLV